MDQQAFRHPQIERDSLMDFSQTPEAIAQGKKARAFGRDVLSLGTVDRDKQRSGSNWRDLWTASAEFGLLGLAIPEEFGGSGHDIQTTVHILKELGYGCTDAGLTLGMGAQIWSMQMPIQEFGTDAQKARYLPEMIAGKTICAHAVTEAASGSDAMSLTTTAKEVDGGFLLNGEKTYIGMAPTCDLAFVFATSNPDHGAWGISAFLVDAISDGFIRGDSLHKMGTRSLPFGSLSFKDCFVPTEALLGKIGSGPKPHGKPTRASPTWPKPPPPNSTCPRAIWPPASRPCAPSEPKATSTAPRPNATCATLWAVSPINFAIHFATGCKNPLASYPKKTRERRRTETVTATLKDVATRAGVSTSAVSRTFTPGASVSERMRKKVEKAANELGYSPNFLARSLTTRRTKLIGLVSNNFHNPIFLEVFDLFTRGLQDRGYRPLLVNLSDETDPQKSLKMMQQYSVDGVIVASSTLPPEFAKAFRDTRIPVVHSFGRFSSTPGFMGGPKDATSTVDRLAGFQQELKKHPSVQLSSSFAGAYSFKAGRSEMTRLLASAPAEAYFCGDDVLSMGAISAIQSAGLLVPDDIGIIGLNDMEMAGWENFNLTTIHQPVREIISSSVELIIAMLEDPERYPESRLFSCSLVERGTLRPIET